MFEGFEQSNTTPVPDILFDQLLVDLSGTELKALLYIIRRTRGFKKESDAISLNQFLKGITTKDGKQLDKGCGIKDRKSLIDALRSLEKKRYIIRTSGMTGSGDSDTTTYSMNFKKAVDKPVKLAGKRKGSGKNQLPVVGKTNDGSMEKPTTRSGKNQLPVVGKTNPQYTVLQQDSTQQTVLQQKVIARGANNQPPLFDTKKCEKPEDVLTPDQLEWFNTILSKCSKLYKVPPKKITTALKDAIDTLFPHIKTLDQLNSLYDYTRAQKFMAGKAVYPGNLAYYLNTWAQTQPTDTSQPEPKPERPSFLVSELQEAINKSHLFKQSMEIRKRAGKVEAAQKAEENYLYWQAIVDRLSPPAQVAS
jgi:hypothetical protein